MSYDIEEIEAPRAAGRMLRALAVALEGRVSGPVLARQLLGNVGLPAFRAVVADDPAPQRHLVALSGAVAPDPGEERSPEDLLSEAAASPALPPAAGYRPVTTEALIEAYRAGETTPLAVAERVLETIDAFDQQDPPMRAFIASTKSEVLEAARASTERWERGEPLGPFDGVPVAVKDELDLRPYPSRAGTTFIGGRGANEDAEVVARLRRAGAVLLGKTNMQEIGLGVFGHNPHYGPARNPYDPGHLCGGSSSGSAAAVAAGLCPLALGVDGGGSIRIPSALCGQVGLMSTFGRVSEHGAVPLAWSVSHVGPIGATVRDVALAYALMAGPDEKDRNTLGQPAPTLADAFPDPDDPKPLDGFVLGIYEPWFEDADPEIVSACRKLVGKLEEAGARVEPIEIPELGLLRTVHLVTIVSEMVASQQRYEREHRRDYSVETRVNLALGRRMKAADYVHAQRLRVRLGRHFDEAFERVDLIVTPTTAATAPRAESDAIETGESNLTMTGRIMRYAPAANLTGRPAISVPAGYDEKGLPIGLQLMGRYWREPVLLRAAAVAERAVERHPPKVAIRLLDD